MTAQVIDFIEYRMAKKYGPRVPSVEFQQEKRIKHLVKFIHATFENEPTIAVFAGCEYAVEALKNKKSFSEAVDEARRVINSYKADPSWTSTTTK